MKTSFTFKKQELMIARFGQAVLIQNSRGTFELRGGGRSDQLAAREWISLFMHEAVPRVSR
jgi:hypothetical protein